MRTSLVCGLGLVLVFAALAAGQPGKKKIDKVDIVSVTGCLRQRAADTWMLVAATEPAVSIANAPPAAEIPKTAPDGKLSFRLIGVGEFKLPTLADRTVVVKGLLIKDQPISRINVTSVAEAVPTCAALAPK
jgi:hypothetical protein